MPKFSEHYAKPETNLSGLVIEAKVKTKKKSITAKALSRLSKFFGKKKEKVNTKKMDNVYRITKGAFNELTTKLSNNLLDKNKKDEDYYIKSIYTGMLSDPKDIDPDWNETITSTIFKTNNGGKIYLIAIKDSDGDVSNYVTANSKMDQWFVDKLGKTYSLYIAAKLKDEAKKKKNIKFIDNIEDDDIDVDGQETIEPEDMVEPNLQRIGVLDIDEVDFDGMVDMWGDGREGHGIYKKTYKYKGAVSRVPFHNNWGDGYIYTIKPGKDDLIYLLQNKDNKNQAVVLFNGDTAVRKAKNLRMIPWLKTKLRWIKSDINKLEV